MSTQVQIHTLTILSHFYMMRYWDTILDGGKLLPQLDKLKPLILTGDFNVNFASDTSIRAFGQTDDLTSKLNLNS